MKKLFTVVLILQISIGLGCVMAAPQKIQKIAINELADMAPFGKPLSGEQIGVIWEVPCEVYQVRVNGVPEPQGRSLRLEWWVAKIGNGQRTMRATYHIATLCG